MTDSSTENSTSNIECSRLFVKNLSGGGKKKGWNEQKLRQLFEKFGAITDIKLKINDKSGAIKFAFVGFENSSSCQTAFEKLNGTFFEGKESWSYGFAISMSSLQYF
uniref:RRM domain-containing protein n=1 Tax=Meloidogyne incognita TaxID=6306 RepID=A0A914KYR3_MELIC